MSYNVSDVLLTTAVTSAVLAANSYCFFRIGKHIGMTKMRKEMIKEARNFVNKNMEHYNSLPEQIKIAYGSTSSMRTYHSGMKTLLRML